ncbi:hypothetical protein AKJ16_DCAP12075 [Drosera capensis]
MRIRRLIIRAIGAFALCCVFWFLHLYKWGSHASRRFTGLLKRTENAQTMCVPMLAPKPNENA